MDSRYRRGRTFALNNTEIQEILWADDSDDELPEVDDEDIAVIDEAIAEGRDFAEIIADDTLAAIRGNDIELEPEQSKFDTAMNPRDIKWSQKFVPPNLPVTAKVIDHGKLSEDVAAAETPFDSFMTTANMTKLIDDVIVPETNRYAHQQGMVFETDNAEIKAFLGVVFFMGYNVLPSMRAYWSTERDLGTPFVTNLMTRTRFVDNVSCFWWQSCVVNVAKGVFFGNGGRARSGTGSWYGPLVSFALEDESDVFPLRASQRRWRMGRPNFMRLGTLS
jgi:hypothetical protein